MSQNRSFFDIKVSGRRDLNPRPHGPEPCALAGLRYAPNTPIIPQHSRFDERTGRFEPALPIPVIGYHF